ncbi:MAG: hypothetical protein KF708_07955 [Pirellulales bacterium]|nr:hypothetical protein [Pirellulales bacterium]
MLELRERIIESHRACLRAQSEAFQHAIDAGESLLAARLQVRPGTWLAWLKDNFSIVSGLTARTAQTYILLAERKAELRALLDAKHGPEASPAALAELTIRSAQRLLRGNTPPRPRTSILRDDSLQLSDILAAFPPEDAVPDVVIGIPDRSAQQVIVQATLDCVELCLDATVIRHSEGELVTAILLMPLQPTATWFTKVADYPLVLMRQLVRFPKRADGPAESAIHPGMLILMADDATEPLLVKHCGKLGTPFGPYRSQR